MIVKVGDSIDGITFFDDFPSPLAQQEKKIITQSAINTWSSCRRKFHNEVNMRLTPKAWNKNFAFGDIWHRLMGAHFTTMAKTQEGLKLKSEKEFDTVEGEIAEMLTSPGFDNDQVHMCHELYRLYCETFTPVQFAKKYRILGVECRFEEKIPGTDWIMSAGMDVVAWHNEKRKLVIIDHKSTASSRKNHMPDPSLNMQGWDYAAVLAQNTGRDVSDVMFIATRKKMPPKTELVDGTLMPSTKRVPDTTYERFIQDIGEATAFINRPEQNENKAALKGRKIKFNEYAGIIQELAGRSDDYGNAYTWMKHAQVTEERRNFFWEHAKRVVEEIEAERKWNMSLSQCENHYGKCVFRNICYYGMTDERIAQGFNIRDNYLSSIVTHSEGASNEVSEG